MEIQPGYCPGSSGAQSVILSFWQSYNGSKRRCPVCGKRLTLRAVENAEGELQYYGIPPHKPKGHKIPKKTIRKDKQ